MAKPNKAAASAPITTPPETPAAETPPVETPVVVAEVAPTPEEIQQRTAALMSSVFGETDSGVNAILQKKRKEQPPEVEVEPEPEPEPEPVSEVPETPVVEPPKPAELDELKSNLITQADVENAARRAARDEISRGQLEEPEPPVDQPPPILPNEEGLSDAEMDHLVVLNELATLNPTHRDLPQRQKAFWKKQEAYRVQWEQANAGESFNPQAEEHAVFYRKNEPFVALRDFKAAERSLVVKEAKKEALSDLRREQEPRLREIELKELERETAPAIANSMADAAEAVFAAAPQFAETFKAKELTKAAIEKMEAINPVLAHEARKAAEWTAILVSELERLDRMKGAYRVDQNKRHRLQNGQIIRPHQVLEDEFAECEAVMLSKPESERMRNGKKLISFDEKTQREQRIKQDTKMRPDQKDRAFKNLHDSFDWVQSADVRKHIIEKAADQVRQSSERFPKNGAGHATTTAPKVAPVAGAAIVRPAAGKSGLARGTSTSSVSDTANNAPKGQNPIVKNRENLARIAFE